MELFSKIALVLGITVFSSQLFAQNGQMQFKTKIIKGTCEFDDNNDLNKNIDFNKNGILVASDVDSKPINQPIRTESFSYTIACKNFPAGTEKSVKIKSKSAASTKFDNGVFFGLNDTTKTGFYLNPAIKTTKIVSRLMMKALQLFHQQLAIQ